MSLTIPIVPNMEMAATHTAEAVLRLMRFSSDQIDEVKHALIEACINAFEHSESREGNVYIKFFIDREQLTLTIQDFGAGFETDCVPRPSLVRKLAGSEPKRGWGLVMMESLMDDVHIDSGPQGTRIVMIKKRLEETAE
ncbi:MAG: ATP-binding protein [Candidatus Sericytochromatia bacterium]|nr:ATP-binding protein [Candidatus Sericytochromatia bacterium]